MGDPDLAAPEKKAHALWAGRTAELAQLATCWDKARTGRAQLVLLTGPLGSGRSALLDRFKEQVRPTGDVLYLSCQPVAEPPVLDLVSSLIHVLIGTPEGAPDGAIATAVARLAAAYEEPEAMAALLGHLLGLDTGYAAIHVLIGTPEGAPDGAIATAVARLAAAYEEPEAMAALLGHLLGLDTGYAAARLLDPAPLQQASFAALGDVLLTRADAWPQLLVFDNLHWADPGSRNWFIDFAMRLSMAEDAQHLMIVAAGTSSGPKDAETVETLGGGGLDATLIEISPLSDAQLRAIAAAKIGHNLGGFSTPVAQVVLELVRRAEGIPAHLLEPLDVLIGVGALDLAGATPALRPDMADYTAGTPFPPDLEEQIARRLASLPGRVLEARARRESPAQEYRYTVRSADRAAQVSVPAEAERLYVEALKWADKIDDWSDPTLPDRNAVVMGLAKVRITLGKVDEALADIARVEQRAGTRSEILHAKGTALERRGEVNEAFEAYTLALGAAKGDAAAAARAKASLADMRRRMGRFTEAILLAEEAKALFETLDLPGEKARVHGVLGICHIRCDEPGRALPELDAALALREGIGDLEGVANVHNSLGILEVSLGKLDQAQADYEESLFIFRKLASVRGAAMALNNLSDLAIRRGDLPRATVYLMEAQRLARQVGHSTEFVTTTGNLAELFLKRGNPKEALKLCDACLSLALRVGQTEFLAELHDLKARAFKQAGDVAASRHEYGLALDAAERAGNASFAEKMRACLEGGR